MSRLPTEMELRVAEAIYSWRDPKAEAVRSIDFPAWGKANHWQRERHIALARVAISAMTEAASPPAIETGTNG